MIMKWYEYTRNYFENREDIFIRLYKNTYTSEFDIIEIKNDLLLIQIEYNIDGELLEDINVKFNYKDHINCLNFTRHFESMEYVEDNFKYLNDFLEYFNRKGFKTNRYFLGYLIYKTELRDLDSDQIIAPVYIKNVLLAFVTKILRILKIKPRVEMLPFYFK